MSARQKTSHRPSVPPVDGGEFYADPSAEQQTRLAPLTTRQAAYHLNTSEDVVRHLFRSGKIYAFKVGGQWRTRNGDVVDYEISQLAKS